MLDAIDYNSGLPGDVDLPVARPGPEPMYSESVLFEGFDPDQSVGIFVGIMSNAHDFELSEGKLFIALPDGELLTMTPNGRNRRPAPNQNGAGGLLATCIEPFRHWVLEYEGAVRRNTTAQSFQGIFADGEVFPVKFRLDLRSIAPAWMMGGGSAQDAAIVANSISFSAHYQQLFAFTGELTWEGRTIQLKGTGHRNHSRGARDFSERGHGEYGQAVFPSGRAFALYRMSYKTRPSISMGFYVEDGVLHHVNAGAATRLEKFAPAGDTLSFEMETPRGLAVIRGTTLHTCGFSSSPPKNWLLGCDRRNPRGAVGVENWVRWEYDGEVGYGLCERWIPVAELPEDAFPD